jgi:hypothetical protein
MPSALVALSSLMEDGFLSVETRLYHSLIQQSVMVLQLYDTSAAQQPMPRWMGAIGVSQATSYPPHGGMQALKPWLTAGSW